MSDPYVGEIRMFGGTYAPYGWSLCNGGLLAISEYSALFNLIGTTYGGNGVSTFAVPNLLGRMPIHAGQLHGGQTYILGELGGLEQVTLTTSQMPSHNHTLNASTDAANAAAPTANVLATTPSGKPYIGNAPARGVMNSASVAQSGGSLPHDNMMPYLCVNFIISLFGIYPSPS